ncbi:MAG: hypothetical protein IT237_03255 [Bacteroidia bacterium]|nr:hypothetical protein [Bacteroidia bacterium]
MKYSKNINRYLLYSFLTIFIFACDSATTDKQDHSKIIAKVNNSVLYEDQLRNILPRGISISDSIAYIKTYINKWAYNEVFYQEALRYLTEEEQNFEKIIENYKKELLTHAFQKKLINEKLDTIITDVEIEEYYNNHSQNFLLRNNIVKVLYIKTPINIPNIDKFKKLCYSTDEKDMGLLKDMCIQYANNYYMNDEGAWLLFDELKKEINQLKEVAEYDIKAGKTFEFTDETSFYFLRIYDVKSKNSLSPLNFEKTNIKNMLINQRKVQLIDAVRKDFFEKAQANKQLEIYN